MTSLALGDLGGRLNEVRRLRRINPKRLDHSSDVETENALNRACIVLLCAHLEGFLEDLVTEAIDILVGRATIENLPLIFRTLHAEQHLKEIELARDRNARAPKIERMFKSEAPLWSDGQLLEATMVRAKAVCDELDNPSSRRIRQFLELIGVDIDLHLANCSERDLLDQVNGLVAKRNSIAHGEVSASATAVDVGRYLDIVEQLGRRVDEAVGLALMRICKFTVLPW